MFRLLVWLEVWKLKKVGVFRLICVVLLDVRAHSIVTRVNEAELGRPLFFDVLQVPSWVGNVIFQLFSLVEGIFIGIISSECGELDYNIVISSWFCRVQNVDRNFKSSQVKWPFRVQKSPDSQSIDIWDMDVQFIVLGLHIAQDNCQPLPSKRSLH